MIKSIMNWWERWETNKERVRIEQREARKKANKTCDFCGKFSSDVEKTVSHVWVHGLYASWKPVYRYHFNCLRAVLNDPEKHGHDKVDLALKITEEMAYWKAEIQKGRDIIGEMEHEK